MIRKSKKRQLFCTVLLCCNLIFIWGNSLLPGEVSGAFSDIVKDFLKWISELILGPQPEDPSGGSGLLRKLAHFTEFACLGLCLSWLVRMHCAKTAQHLLIPLFAGFAAACIDETIQIFVPERGPAIKDVGIDTAGVTVGIVLITLIYNIKHKKSKKLEETL